jgi:hypothetical protein
MAVHLTAVRRVNSLFFSMQLCVTFRFGAVYGRHRPRITHNLVAYDVALNG